MGKRKTPNIRLRADGRFEARIVTGYDPKTGKQIRRSIYGHSVKEVEPQLNLIRLALDRGDYQGPCRLTVQEWAEIWFATFAVPKLKPVTAKRYRGILDNHILPALGAARLTQIKPWQIQSLYNNMTSGVAQNVQAVLNQIFDTALKQRYISVNPCIGVNLPKSKKEKTPPLQENEAAALVEAVRGTKWENIIIVALLCGHREGELLGLSWDDIDFKNGQMTIKQQLNREKEIVSTKTGKARTFVMPPAVIQALQSERCVQLERQKLVGACWDNKYNLCFTDELGQPIVVSTFYREVKKLGERIGRPDIHPHTLRHYCATAAVAAGASLKSTQNILGHSSSKMTLDIYAENTDQQAAEAAALIQARFEASGVKMGSESKE